MILHRHNKVEKDFIKWYARQGYPIPYIDIYNPCFIDMPAEWMIGVYLKYLEEKGYTATTSTSIENLIFFIETNLEDLNNKLKTK